VAHVKPGERVSCKVADLVDRAVETQQNKASEQKVAIRKSVNADLQVRCDKSRIERVLVNLIVNALEVMPAGGEISMAAAADGASVSIEIADTGPGIPEEIRGKLFEPFATAGKRNGLGLGLALARQTLLDHGGDLELRESSRGARFCLRLPRELSHR
jgi:signal transduction histidine kinase